MQAPGRPRNGRRDNFRGMQGVETVGCSAQLRSPGGREKRFPRDARHVSCRSVGDGPAIPIRVSSLQNHRKIKEVQSEQDAERQGKLADRCFAA